MLGDGVELPGRLCAACGCGQNAPPKTSITVPKAGLEYEWLPIRGSSLTRHEIASSIEVRRRQLSRNGERFAQHREDLERQLFNGGKREPRCTIFAVLKVKKEIRGEFSWGVMKPWRLFGSRYLHGTRPSLLNKKTGGTNRIRAST